MLLEGFKQLIFLTILMPLVLSGYKLKILSLNNGGKIMSLITDYIILRATTVTMKDVIRCPKAMQYIQFKPGSLHKFNDVWIDSGYVNIQLQQINLFSKSDSATIRYSFQGAQTGIYMANLLLSDFQTNVTIGMEYMGVGAYIQFQQQRQADYYLFLELTNQYVQTDTYGFSSDECRLFWEQIRANIYILGLIVFILLIGN